MSAPPGFPCRSSSGFSMQLRLKMQAANCPLAGDSSICAKRRAMKHSSSGPLKLGNQVTKETVNRSFKRMQDTLHSETTFRPSLDPFYSRDILRREC